MGDPLRMVLATLTIVTLASLEPLLRHARRRRPRLPADDPHGAGRRRPAGPAGRARPSTSPARDPQLDRRDARIPARHREPDHTSGVWWALSLRTRGHPGAPTAPSRHCRRGCLGSRGGARSPVADSRRRRYGDRTNGSPSGVVGSRDQRDIPIKRWFSAQGGLDVTDQSSEHTQDSTGEGYDQRRPGEVAPRPTTPSSSTSQGRPFSEGGPVEASDSTRDAESAKGSDRRTHGLLRRSRGRPRRGSRRPRTTTAADTRLMARRDGSCRRRREGSERSAARRPRRPGPPRRFLSIIAKISTLKL